MRRDLGRREADWVPGVAQLKGLGRVEMSDSDGTDRLHVVVSGVWWGNSGPDFDPHNAVPARAGSFVRRVAGTPHYDSARPDATEPAAIAVTGIGPVEQT